MEMSQIRKQQQRLTALLKQNKGVQLDEDDENSESSVYSYLTEEQTNLLTKYYLYISRDIFRILREQVNASSNGDGGAIFVGKGAVIPSGAGTAPE